MGQVVAQGGLCLEHDVRNLQYKNFKWFKYHQGSKSYSGQVLTTGRSVFGTGQVGNCSAGILSAASTRGVQQYMAGWDGPSFLSSEVWVILWPMHGQEDAAVAVCRCCHGCTSSSIGPTFVPQIAMSIGPSKCERVAHWNNWQLSWDKWQQPGFWGEFWGNLGIIEGIYKNWWTNL